MIKFWFQRHYCVNANLNSNVEVCQPPTLIPNGIFTLQGDPTQSSGAVAIYQCNANFVLVGNHSHTCVSGSTWDLPLPTCSRMYVWHV